MKLGFTRIVFILLDPEISKQCGCILTGFGRRNLSTELSAVTL